MCLVQPDYVAGDTEGRKERERGRKGIFLQRGCSTESDKGDENTAAGRTLGFVCLAAGTARCLSVWPVALFPQSSAIFQASPISANKAMELFSLSQQPFGLSTTRSIGPKPPSCRLNACSKDRVHSFIRLPLLWT